MTIDRVKLIAEMARQRIKVVDLAQKAGVSRVTVTAVRCGKTCSGHTATALANALGVPVSDLLPE